MHHLLFLLSSMLPRQAGSAKQLISLNTYDQGQVASDYRVATTSVGLMVHLAVVGLVCVCVCVSFEDIVR